MLTVAILKNGHPLLARSAINRLATEGVYICDDGTRIEHKPEEGAVALAKKMLDTIVEPPNTKDKTMSANQRLGLLYCSICNKSSHLGACV